MCIPHQPVLQAEILTGLHLQTGYNIVDGTLGAGGHARAVLNCTAPTGRLLGLDVDPIALQIAQTRLQAHVERVEIVQANFDQLQTIVLQRAFKPIHAIILDLGVSSMQLDQAERGFSFQHNGPLDMRMGPKTTQTAAKLVNTMPEADLADLIYRYGEERKSRQIAKAILKARPLQTTLELAEIIGRTLNGGRWTPTSVGRSATSRKSAKTHPATRTFMALRIAVNDELGSLERFLPQALDLLTSGGRLGIISFHSLEDRLIKHYFQQEARGCICSPEQPVCTCQHDKRLKIITAKPIVASEAEIAQNPRSRSAKLRIVEKF